MYLPLGLSFLLPVWVQEQFITTGGQHRDLAVLSPYHDAPSVPGVSANLPDDCTVDQVIVLHRHGSRGPEFEHAFIQELVKTLDHSRDLIRATPLPSDLQFLKEGYEYSLVPEQLTVVGRRELFDHGVEFALRYPDFSTDFLLSSPVQRVVDSSHFFAQGFFGLAAENITIRTVKDLDDPVSWITPWKSCPKFSTLESHKVASQWAVKYALPIAQRFNKLVPGLNISLNDTRGALYACPFDLAANNQSPWCNVFSTHELKNLEYEYDLLMDGISGHASRGDPGPFLGAFYVQKLIERLTNATGKAQRLYLEFGHDTSILLPLSTMDLNKYSTSQPTSYARASQVQNLTTNAFRCKHGLGEVYLQKLVRQYLLGPVSYLPTVTSSFQGPQVRLVLNGATFPLSICGKSRQDRRYGSCSLGEFTRANEYSTSIQYKSESWNRTCEGN